MIDRDQEVLRVRALLGGHSDLIAGATLGSKATIGPIHHLAFLEEGSTAQAVFARQCTGAGFTFSFDIKGGEKEAFALAVTA